VLFVRLVFLRLSLIDMPIKIVRADGSDGLAQFMDFPPTVYRGDPFWIPPLREQILHELSAASVFSRYGRFQLFMCEANGRMAGRIAALVNPKLVDRHGSVLGQLGYFECIDDTSVAAALIDAGLDWLGSQGAREVLAPMNGGAHRAHRLLTRGFDEEPFLFEPRNPRYYPRLFEQCGFSVAYRWFGYELNRDDAAVRLSQLERVLSRRPPPGVVEELDTGRGAEIVHRLHRLLDGCWLGHVGYAPIDLEEFAEVFRGGLSIMSRGNIAVFVQDGRDSGLALTYPDYAAEVRALDGSAAGWGRWLGQARPKRLVLHTAALLQEVRHTSAAMALLAWSFRRAWSDGFEDLLVALAVEGFLGKVGKQTREYALYSRTVV
jgi:hypothetical protein